MAALKTLDDAIRAALTEPVASATVRDLVNTATKALEAAGTRQEAARKAALDPRAAPAVVTSARRQAEECAFERDRLASAVEELEARATDLRAAETKHAAAVEYAEAVAERDALAREIADRYPALSEELVSLLRRIELNDQRISAAGQGARVALASSEAVGRGVTAHFEVRGLPVTRLTEMRIPKFDDHGLLWPVGRFT